MSKSLYIAEKPSVAAEFAKALKISGKKQDGYIESEEAIVTWCVGHLITMSYPEVYDPALKKWSMDTLPFLPKEYKYEVISNVRKQFNIVKGLLTRKDVDTIYVCTDSGREGEYIYRLVEQEAKVSKSKDRRRVWIDSQTEEEILRGIREAKPLSAYDPLANAAYLRAQEDYLMGINFSRILTLKYGNEVQRLLNSQKWNAISVGRVMTCVLGMVVRREREIRSFVKTPFYRVLSGLQLPGGLISDGNPSEDGGALSAGKEFMAEFRAVEGSRYYNSPLLYKENGFSEKTSAMKLISELAGQRPVLLDDGTWEAKQEEQTISKQTDGVSGQNKTVLPPDRLLAEITQMEKKKETKNPPLLYNLAELQNDCSRFFKISPDETLKITQELYEKKLVTYPRTDARVLSTAVAKEIYKNIKGLQSLGQFSTFVTEIMEQGSYKNIAKTRYVNDSQITDHYAIIPTGQGLGAMGSLSQLAMRVYETIARRFLSIFYPAAEYRKINIVAKIEGESFFASFRMLEKEGYLKVLGSYGDKSGQSASRKSGDRSKAGAEDKGDQEDSDAGEEESNDQALLQMVMNLKKGEKLPVRILTIKEGETAPPKRYGSGSLILAMENAGQLIEDEELRAQIKGSGIGTSATRAEILNKLVNITYLNLNKKTQIITPTQLGELIYDVVNSSIKSLLNAELTASWEKGLTYVSGGQISKEEYTQKLESFVFKMVDGVKKLNNQAVLTNYYQEAAGYYKK